MPKLAKQKPDVVFRNALPRETSYMIADGFGLNLQVTPEGVKRWVFRYCKNRLKAAGRVG